jgi:hypothetical protein
MLQVRGLTAQTGAVIHDLAINLTSGKIYKAQDSPSIRAQAFPIDAVAPNDPLLKDFFIS